MRRGAQVPFLNILVTHSGLMPEPPEHRKRNHEPNRHDCPADSNLRYPHRHVRAKVTAKRGRTGHYQGIRPDNETHERKAQHRNAVDANAQEILNSIGAVDVMQTEKSHRREHQDTVSRAEVTTVYRGKKLKHDG